MPQTTPNADFRDLDPARQQGLLEAHLKFYDSLATGSRKPTSPAQQHFVSVMQGETEPKTDHEFAYLNHLAECRSDTPPEADDEAKSLLHRLKERLNQDLLEIENRDDLSEDEKMGMIVNRFSIVCAAVAVQPIPFADIFILTPIQIFMAQRLASIRGLKVSESKAREIFMEVSKVVGLSMLAQQVALGLYKTGLPFLAGFTTIPLVYGLTYGMGRALDYNYKELRKGRKASEREIKDVFRRMKKEGQEVGKASREDVKSVKV